LTSNGHRWREPCLVPKMRAVQTSVPPNGRRFAGREKLIRWMLVMLVAAACFGFANPSRAQSKADTQPIDLFALGAPSFTNFFARDGLPDSVLSSIQTDREGFVWVGSAKGTSRYDGRRWSNAAPSLNGTLGEFMSDHEGTLWVAFRDSGIARYDGSG